MPHIEKRHICFIYVGLFYFSQYGVVEDVRTIFMRQNQYIYIPDLSDFENRHAATI
jgi:hypothetical protein